MATDQATADGPSRRRSSWSLKTIVEDVAGKPIGEFQDPERPVHPYLLAKGAPPTDPAGAHPAPAEPPYDPVSHLYPPMVGPPGREYHGPDHEHHAETLERHRPPAPGPGERARAPGPTHKPERLYLHYLLLHMDRLSDAALRYLRTAVEEEIAHRGRQAVTPPVPAHAESAASPAPEGATPSPAVPTA